MTMAKRESVSGREGEDVLEPLMNRDQRPPLKRQLRTVNSSGSMHESTRPPYVQRQVSVGKKTFEVTNYGSVDLEPLASVGSLEAVAIDIPESPVSPLAPSALYTRRHSTPLRRLNSHPTYLPVQTEEMMEDVVDDVPSPDDVFIADFNANRAKRKSSLKYKSVVYEDEEEIRDLTNDGLKNNVESCTVNKSTSWPKKSSKVMMEVARMGRLYSKRKQRRLMNKSGYCNLNYIEVEKRSWKYLADIFTTFLEIKWRYTMMCLFITFALSWLLFGLLWWAIVVPRNNHDPGCVVGVTSFTTALLFSIETQHTIGYGTRAVTDVCPSAVILVMIQSIVGVMISCIMTGIVFAKLARPKRRGNTVMFSNKAVIHNQNGNLCLMFRVGDMRSTQMMGVTINAMLIRTEINDGGTLLSTRQDKLTVSTEAEDNFYFLAWPAKVVHIIDESSPLWDLSAEDMMVADFEIIVVLEAVCEASGGSTQVRTSYLPSEIQWGYKLAPLFTEVKKGSGKYTINFNRFHDIIPVATPGESASNLMYLVHGLRGSPARYEKPHFTLESQSSSQQVTNAVS